MFIPEQDLHPRIVAEPLQSLSLGGQAEIVVTAEPHGWQVELRGGPRSGQRHFVHNPEGLAGFLSPIGVSPNAVALMVVALTAKATSGSGRESQSVHRLTVQGGRQPFTISLTSGPGGFVRELPRRHEIDARRLASYWADFLIRLSRTGQLVATPRMTTGLDRTR